MKYIKNRHGRQIPDLSEEELKDIHFHDQTKDNRFEILTDYNIPEKYSETTIYFKDKETKKLYAVQASMNWKEGKLFYHSIYEVDRIEKPFIAYKNSDLTEDLGYYLNFKEKKNSFYRSISNKL